MKKIIPFIIAGIILTFALIIIITAQKVKTMNTRQFPSQAATTTYIPNPPSYYFELPDNLRNFLEQLYLTVYFFHLPSNLSNLLEGLVTVTPTPMATAKPTTPTAAPRVNTPTATPKVNTPTVTPIQSTSGGLHISGTTLMSSNNQRFIIKGANVEFFRDSGCSNITTGQYAVRTQLAQKFKSLGINAVRLNMSLGWLGQSSNNLNQYMDMMQTFASQGIYSMPSDHSYTGKSLSGSSASYGLFKNIIEGARSRGIENYLIMNPYNEPYNSANWSEWETENKNTVNYLRNTAKFKGPIVLDTPSWAGAYDTDLSSYNALITYDKSISGTSNILFSNHWYPNINISNPTSAASKANQVPLVIGEIGQINPGVSGLDPNYTKSVLSNAIASMPNGHNGVFPWIWNWCDENSMTNGDYLTLNSFGQLIDTNFYKKF